MAKLNENLLIGETSIPLINSTIIEIGSNANGKYVKYGNGLMICTKHISQSIQVNDSWVSWYETSLALGSWAKEFVDIPMVSVTNVSASGLLVQSFNPSPSRTNAGTVYLTRPSSGTHVATLDIIAIGKWK